MKRGRGRPSKASLAAAAAAAAAANESLSSLGTSTYSSADSVSGYSTPLTSNVTTPAPVDNVKATSTRSTRSANIDTASPALKSRGSGATSNLRANNRSVNASSRVTRRNRLDVVPDSEDFENEDEIGDRRILHDEEVARSLQNELNREVEGFLIDDDAEEQSVLESDSEDYAATDPKGKGKAVSTRKASGTRAAAKKHVVQDSEVDDDDDDDDDSDFADLAPPAKKQKTTARGRGKQAAAKGKQVAAALVSDSDDDLPCKSPGTTLTFPSKTHTHVHTLWIIPMPTVSLPRASISLSHRVISSTPP